MEAINLPSSVKEDLIRAEQLKHEGKFTEALQLVEKLNKGDLTQEAATRGMGKRTVNRHSNQYQETNSNEELTPKLELVSTLFAP